MLKSIFAAVSGGLILLAAACGSPSAPPQAKTVPAQTARVQVIASPPPAVETPAPPPVALPEQTANVTAPPCPLAPAPADLPLYNLGYDIEATPITPQSGFVFSHLQIFPELSVVDDNVTISVNMTNPGNMPGQYQVNLNYGGDLFQTQNVTLNAGITQEVDFSFYAVYGEHAVTAGNLTAPTVMRVVY